MLVLFNGYHFCMLLHICNIGKTHFAIDGGHLQTVTICNRFITLLNKPVLENFPIVPGILVRGLVR